jgi:hypothetical protein
MSQHFFYPPSSAIVSNNPSVGPSNDPVPNQATLIGGEDGTGDLIPVAVDSDGHVQVDIQSMPAGSATAANQLTQIAHEAAIEAAVESIDAKLTNPLPVSGPLTDAQLRAVAVPVSATSLPLPTGAATSANQATQITHEAAIETAVESIDTKTPALVSGRVPVDGSGVTQPISAASLPLPTGAATQTTLAALSAKSAGSLVPEAYDYIGNTYTGDNLTTVVYKTGGAAGTTVATLTMAYTGSRLDSVTRT